MKRNEMTYNNFEEIVENIEEKNFIQRHPLAAALVAAALIGAPAAGIGVSNMLSGAAELPADEAAETAPANVQASYVSFGSGVSTSTQNTAAGSEKASSASKDMAAGRIVSFVAEGPGHIEPVENCTIDGVSSTITIADASKNASFKLVNDVDGAHGNVDLDAEHFENLDVAVIESGKSFSTLKITFVAPANVAVEAPVAAAPAAPVVNDAPAPVYEAPFYEEPAPVYEEPAPVFVDEPIYEEPAPVIENAPVYEEPAPAHTETIYYTTDNNGTRQLAGAPDAGVNSGQRAHSMNGEEMAVARDIVNAYNDYRASKGLARVAWDDDCANMGYASASGCAAQGKLVHRLGISGHVQNVFSDILQYSSWKMNGAEAVEKWRNSTGHRKMMQCDSANRAGVGVFKNSDGRWYYAIVYNFSGSNQSGN